MYRTITNLINTKLKLTNQSILPQVISGYFIKNPLRKLSNGAKSQHVYLLDEDQNITNHVNNKVNKYTERTYTCGDLRQDNVGETVILCGWLEYQRMNKFVVLRDSYGATQLLIKETDLSAQEALDTLPLESIIQIQGTVLSRPLNMRNSKQQTGDVEVLVDKFQILNCAKTNLPFNIREYQKAKESLRMQYRYLDLRFPFMQRNLRVRSEMLMKMREFLVNRCGFVDVETPTLFKATPGGAQEFIVPTRFPGEFYSLVQSPQQFKQMLMAGCIDRYFQIARCYRDESARSDRQPEFTQLDIEMSFTNLDNVLKLIEDLLSYCWPKFLDPIPNKFERIPYKQAMELYGTDQPDTRLDFKLQNCTEILSLNPKLCNVDNFGAYCLIFPKQYANLTKSLKETFTSTAKQYNNAHLIQNKITNCNEWITKISKLLTEPLAQKFLSNFQITDGCVVFLAYGDRIETQTLLGRIRLDYANHLENLGINLRKKGVHLLWITDFPLFESGDAPGTLNSAHHPFTAPHPDDVHLLDSSPLQVRSLSYDLVLNGNEIGGGSIRIHDPNLQRKLFKLLNISVDKMQHIIDMLSSGCPPHGGIALGIDRLMSKILNTTSIRDVIAFPKTFDGRDPLSGAPSQISEVEEKLYHIKTTK